MKLANMVYYYNMTILAQLAGALRQAVGKSKSFWEKAESTR
jgi:heme oxygenase